MAVIDLRPIFEQLEQVHVLLVALHSPSNKCDPGISPTNM